VLQEQLKLSAQACELMHTIFSTSLQSRTNLGSEHIDTFFRLIKEEGKKDFSYK
jgi:hypothetical protein